MTSSASEVNFDGLVGPTHNYAGLSIGNQASMGNAGAVSSPRRAALQGLAKMRLFHQMGVPQGIIPPQWRPDSATLASLGFDRWTDVPAELIPTLSSASAMWAANAATVSPSADTADGRVHLTPANLSSTAHRSFEATQTKRALEAIFADDRFFAVHPPLPQAAAFADEGAANHARLCSFHGSTGLHVFVYGREANEQTTAGGYPRRQSRLAGELIARSHGLDPQRVVHTRQAEAAIDAGAFHNDVVSVANQDVLFGHELAFADPSGLVSELTEKCDSQFRDLHLRHIEVPDAIVPLADAVSSYLFNSQLVSVPDGSMALIAPAEVQEIASTAAYLKSAVADAANPIASVHTLDLRESMRNGGGPACLRLRVVLSDEEAAALSGRVIVDDRLLDDLGHWVETHYRDELYPSELSNPTLIDESARALTELAGLLELDTLYK